MIRMLLARLLLLLLCVGSSPVAAGTWPVAADGTGDFSRVSDACYAAASGDTVLVSVGEYDEPPESRIYIEDKELIIVGLGVTPADVSLSLRFFFDSCSGVVLENLLFHDRAYAACSWGGGYLLVRNCRFERHTGDPNPISGGAVCGAYGALVEIEDSVFIGNQALAQSGAGAAVGASSGQVIIRRCVFVDNTATAWGGAIDCPDNCIIEDCVFFRNEAGDGAAIIAGPNPTIQRCTFLANRVTMGGATITLRDFDYISHCIVAGTIAGYGVSAWGPSNAECCAFWENELGPSDYSVDVSEDHGNIFLDPMLCDPETGDVGLLEGSPCLPGNHGGVDCELIGAKDLGCGDVPVLRVTWGEVKALYR